jgi:hypothetical protein
VPNARKLNVMLLLEVEQHYKPVAVVLSDFLNFSFSERHYGLHAEDLDGFSCPVSAFDLYDFAATQGRVDTYGFYAKNMRALTLDRYQRLLQPCPVIPPSPSPDARAYRYPLFSEVPDHSVPADRERARAELGLPRGSKVLLVTSALWQTTFRASPDVLSFVQACQSAADRLLASVSERVTVISVGAAGAGSRVPIPGLRHYAHMPPAEFERVVSACDVLVANNYISTSMARMVLRGVPTLLLQSSVMKGPGGEQRWFGRDDRPMPAELEGVERAYPFRMFPVGWHAFLRPVVRANPFYRIMRHAELFDPDEGRAAVGDLLDGADDARREPRRHAYLDQLARLPKVESEFPL